MNELTQLAHQGGIGTIAVYLIEYLKNANWFPRINQNSAKINRWVGITIALATSVGFKFASTTAADGGHNIAIYVPSFLVFFDMLTHAAAQFAGQQILYHTAVKDTILPAKASKKSWGL